MQQKEGGSNKKTALPIIQKWFEPNEHYRNCILSRRANGVRARLFAFFSLRDEVLFWEAPVRSCRFSFCAKQYFPHLDLQGMVFFVWIFLFQYLGNEFLAAPGPLL